MDTKHTPTPWEMGGYDEILGPDRKMLAMCMLGVGQDPSNGAFIVRAVNHYEALVEIVRSMTFDATGDSTGDMIRFGQACDRGRALLATLDAEAR